LATAKGVLNNKVIDIKAIKCREKETLFIEKKALIYLTQLHSNNNKKFIDLFI